MENQHQNRLNGSRPTHQPCPSAAEQRMHALGDVSEVPDSVSSSPAQQDIFSSVWQQRHRFTALILKARCSLPFKTTQGIAP